MQSSEELKSLRIKLQDELDFHKQEILRLSKALEALETVEGLLGQNGRQTTIQEVQPLAGLGAPELVEKIICSSGRKWSMAAILHAAKEGGNDLNRWTKPYNVLYVAAKRLAKKGRIQVNREKDGTVTYSRPEN